MNLLAAPPLLLIAILDAEIDLLLLESMASFEAMGWLLLSCGLGMVQTSNSGHLSPAITLQIMCPCLRLDHTGLGMSYFSFLSRAMVSATYFTVIGNMCKLLSVVINILLWDKHVRSSPHLSARSLTEFFFVGGAHIVTNRAGVSLAGVEPRARQPAGLPRCGLHVRAGTATSGRRAGYWAQATESERQVARRMPHGGRAFRFPHLPPLMRLQERQGEASRGHGEVGQERPGARPNERVHGDENAAESAELLEKSPASSHSSVIVTSRPPISEPAVCRCGRVCFQCHVQSPPRCHKISQLARARDRHGT